jgi:PTS system N-acetylgalactosamine-specific IIA component
MSDGGTSLTGASPVPPVRARAIVAGHGGFPEGIISAVEAITGQGSQLVSFSNARYCRDVMEQALRDVVAQHGARVIFTDLPAGSATLAARRVMREDPSLTLIAGVNLATLVDFVLSDPSLPAGDAALHAAEKGRAAMMTFAPSAPASAQGG